MHKKDITVTFACLDCCKVFKKHKFHQDNHGNWEPIDYEVTCPQCGHPLYETGSAFKAPKAKDLKAWAKLKPLFEKGYKFNPDFGSPFDKPEATKNAVEKTPESQFKKSVRKRAKNAWQGT